MIDEKTDEGKRLLKIIDLNKLAFTELVLSIDISSTTGKNAFEPVKSCKAKEYEDGNAALSWEKLKLKEKLEPISDPSLVKTERMFRENKLNS